MSARDYGDKLLPNSICELISLMDGTKHVFTVSITPEELHSLPFSSSHLLIFPSLNYDFLTSLKPHTQATQSYEGNGDWRIELHTKTVEDDDTLHRDKNEERG